MSYLHDEIDDEASHLPREKEVTLSTGAILGIFFGLVLLCAVFFGFGYSMGNRSHQAPAAVTETTPPPSATDFSAFKPAAGSTAVSAAPAPKPSAADNNTNAATSPAPAVRTPAPAPAASVPTRSHEAIEPTPRSVPATETGLSFIVQVAAVSHPEDADLLVAALKRKGYAVTARNEPQDKLLHIQIGPFAAKHDADAMRQRLLADGYNAIVK